MPEPGFRAATYNVHAWIGTDGVFDPQRITGVINALDADIVVLQEVTIPFDDPGSTTGFLTEQSGMTAVPGITMVRPDAHYGNFLLTRLPLGDMRLHDISVPGVEPRGIIEALVETPAGSVTVFGTHLGLKRAERRYQVGRIMECIAGAKTDRIILLGDLNDWVPGAFSLAPLTSALTASPNKRTFPSKFPLFALDRAFTRHLAITGARTMRTGDATRASDHLPLVVDIEKL